MMLSEEFLFAGNAIFTVSNASGKYFTYKVVQKELSGRNFYFVYLLTGPDNTSDYTYLGTLNYDTVKLTPKSKFTPDSLPVKVIRWAVIQMIKHKEIPQGYSIRHIGKCGKCGRPLTTPESLEDGIGPICKNRKGSVE